MDTKNYNDLMMQLLIPCVEEAIRSIEHNRAVNPSVERIMLNLTEAKLQAQLRMILRRVIAFRDTPEFAAQQKQVLLIK